MSGAHNVRKLATCAGCGRLAVKDRTVTRKREKVVERFHGACYLERYGEDAFLARDPLELSRLSLADIGPDMMRKVLRELEERAQDRQEAQARRTAAAAAQVTS